VRVPPDAEIHAPEFPPKLDWLGVAFLRMDRLIGQHAVLLEFWDFARINSVRTLPYLVAWHERYGDRGLRVIGVHSPGYSFGRDPDTAARAAERLAVPFPVVLDPDFKVWHLYGNKGWPARYLFDRRGHLRHMHYGEGEYAEAEETIQELLREIDPDVDLPTDTVPPLRPEDAPGVLLEPQTEDIALPTQRDRLELVRDWTDGEDYIENRDAGASAKAEFVGGAAYAVLSGADIDPGIYEAPEGRVLADTPGLRIHGFQFTPMPPKQ